MINCNISQETRTGRSRLVNEIIKFLANEIKIGRCASLISFCSYLPHFIRLVDLEEEDELDIIAASEERNGIARKKEIIVFMARVHSILKMLFILQPQPF